jgi:hypothetical protein
MTPKDKAKKLTLKFMKIDSDSEKFDEFEMKLFYAQRCALIAVDELIESHLLLTTTHDSEPSIRCKRYWQEVKQEIEKL